MSLDIRGNKIYPREFWECESCGGKYWDESNGMLYMHKCVKDRVDPKNAKKFIKIDNPRNENICQCKDAAHKDNEQCCDLWVGNKSSTAHIISNGKGRKKASIS